MCTNCEGRAFDLGIYTGGIRVASASAGIEGLNFERELVSENTLENTKESLLHSRFPVWLFRFGAESARV